jgi:CheY-like chemotaxis protein
MDRSNIKASHPGQSERDSEYSASTRATAVSVRISDPARTLLVVDDDPMFRKLESRILRLEGYTVLEAGSALQALCLAACTATIDLLVTDFSMPGIDGLELTRRFRKVHPESPMLMVSGALPLFHGGTPEADRIEFLEKPFQVNELLRKVRTLLDIAAPLPRRKWSCRN